MKTKRRPRCSAGTYCGDSCISRKVKCRIKLTDQQKAEIREVVKKFQRERKQLPKIQQDKKPVIRPKDKPGRIVETPDKVVPPLKKVGDKVKVPANPVVERIVKILRYDRTVDTVHIKPERVRKEYRDFYDKFPGAPRFDGTIVFKPLGPGSLGMILEDKRTIVINSERSVGMQTRTIHHELAHYVEDSLPKVLAKSIEYLRSGQLVPRAYSRVVYLDFPDGKFVSMDFHKVPSSQVKYIVATELFATLVESKHPGTTPGTIQESLSLNKLWREYQEIING